MQNILEIPLQKICSAREYTLSLLEDLEPEDWFRMPQEGVTHIAWQAGHIAMAQFRLCLERLRNLQPGDWDLIPKEFLKSFGKGTTPSADRSLYPEGTEILAVMCRVHEAVRIEVPKYAATDLTTPLRNPHPIFKTKLEALSFCAQHEMLHAGQIGLLRRLIGKSPVR